MAPNTPQQTSQRPETENEKVVGSDFSNLETTFKSQLVSFGIVISFSTFQTHLKVLQLYFRLQDRFYTHHWFCHFFKPFYGSKCLPLCLYRTKLLFYSFSLLDVIYIKKSFRFGILWSPLQSISYIFKLCLKK